MLSVTNPGNASGLLAVEGETPDDSTDSARFGLTYVRERLRQFYGNDARFRLEPDGNETVASIDIPLILPAATAT
jgi:hypothetical protein